MDRRLAETGYSGIVLPDPPRVPDAVLTDTQGEAWSLPAEMAGKTTLLFFGFTNCPDICPVHMANLAAVFDRLDADVRQALQVVFVTVDPARDTPERIRSWLDALHPSFIGLWADFETVDGLLRELNLGGAYIDEEEAADGVYGVGHSAQVLAFTPDGLAHVTYPFGIRQQDWQRDLPKLVRSAWARP